MHLCVIVALPVLFFCVLLGFLGFLSDSVFYMVLCGLGVAWVGFLFALLCDSVVLLLEAMALLGNSTILFK